jgi:hypothetical protein
VQNLDLHGNTLRELPLGLRQLTQLSRLNLVGTTDPFEYYVLILCSLATSSP